jgi:Ca2+/Na+ antiporter
VLFCQCLPSRGEGTGSTLTALLIVLLAVLWGAVFLPTILRSRHSSSPITSVGTFRRGMSALGPGRSGRWIVTPTTPEDHLAARRRSVYRRRQVFTAMLFAAAMTLLLAIVPDLRWMLKVHLGVDALLLAYVVILLRIKSRKSVEKPIVHRHQPEPMPEEDEEEPYLRVGQL